MQKRAVVPRAAAATAAVVLLLFVLTRWPSGNLWDALLDPLLWLGLQVRWAWAWRGRRA